MQAESLNSFDIPLKRAEFLNKRLLVVPRMETDTIYRSVLWFLGFACLHANSAGGASNIR